MIWLLILKGGLIAGSIGPLPSNMQGCEQVAMQKNAEVQHVINTGKGLNGKKMTVKEIGNLRSIHFECTVSPFQPVKTYRP